MTVDLDELERAANAIRPDQRGVPAFSAEQVLALIARLREAERDRDAARKAWGMFRGEARRAEDERDRLKAELAEAVGVIQRWVSWCDDWHAGKPHPSDDLDAARTFLAKHGGHPDD